MQDRPQPYLVPGRECGDCQVCCILPSIDKPEIQKLTGSACRHCVSGGCGVYETRPEICRVFYCGWRRTEDFPDDWRPDKSGIFGVLEANTLPYFGPVAVCLTLAGNPLKTIRRHDFIDYVGRSVRKNIAIYLNLPGPRGRQSARLPVNNQVNMGAHTRTEVRAVLEKILKRLTAHNFMPCEMEHSGHDVST